MVNQKISKLNIKFVEVPIKYNGRSYKEGKKMGLEIVYNKEGKKTGEYFLTDNIKNGKEKIFYDNGKLREERTYKMGKDHGNTKMYYESGLLQIDAQFANGKPHGPWIIYFENGISSRTRYIFSKHR